VNLKVISTLAVVCLFSSCSSADRPFQVIVGARLTDPPIDHSVVIIKDGVITAIGAQQTVPIPADSTKTNGLGQIVGAPDPSGKLTVGGPADLVLLDENHKVVKMMRAGKWIGDQR
jgi:N-acetylglucosamine-6-phosphate deacetylase